MSKSGDQLLGKRSHDGRFRIVRYRADGTVIGTSNGPNDVMPGFSADGKKWVYVNYEHRSLLRCTFDHGECSVIASDDMMPSWPEFSPDGMLIAYVTQINTPRLRLVPAEGGKVVDLGPARAGCPPVWVTRESLWFYSGTQKEPRWLEVNPITLAKTGRQKTASLESDRADCSVPEEGSSSPFFRRIRVEVRESSAVRIVSGGVD